MKNIIATWIYCEKKGEENEYPQVSGLSSSQKFQNIYWRCVADYFATAYRFNKGAEFLLFTNVTADELPVIDGVSVGSLLNGFGVTIVTLPYTCRIARDNYNKWGNQFYIFDILKYVSSSGKYGDRDRLIVLDSDCVWTQPGDRIFDDIGRNGLLAYEVYKSEDYTVNGLSRADMREIYSDLLGYTVNDNPVYYGGEWFAADVDACRKVYEEFVTLKNILADRLSAGKKVFNEEAHTLSYIYYKLGFAKDTASVYIRRIWTTLFVYENVTRSDYDLTIWHLPSEKRFGLKRLFKLISDTKNRFYKGNNYHSRKILGRTLGVPGRTPGKFVLDLTGAVIARMSRIIGKK